MLRRTDRNGPLDSAPATTADMNTSASPITQPSSGMHDSGTLIGEAERHDDHCDPAPARRDADEGRPGRIPTRRPRRRGSPDGDPERGEGDGLCGDHRPRPRGT